MNVKTVFKKNKKIYVSIALVVLEGLFAGCNFIGIYGVIRLIFGTGTDFSSLLKLTGFVGAIFGIRLILYCIGYTQGQIGGAKLSKNIRLSLGDKLKRIPLGQFTRSQIGFYINAVTTEISSYENILTHKVGDIIKYFVLIVMVIVFVGTMYIPAALVLLGSTLLLIPAMMLSLHFVKVYGNRKNRVSADNVSSMTEYITGIQTLRAYGMGGKKNKTLTKAMKDFSDISFVYEEVVIPVGMVYSAIEWAAMPVIIWIAGKAWLSGALPIIDFLIISMIPLFVCKVNGTLFVNLTSYKNLMISKKRIVDIIEEKEETVGNHNFAPKSHEIEFDGVNFAYVEGEQVLKNVNFTAKDKRLTAIVGPSGSGKSTILNLLSKYYNPQNGNIKIGRLSICDAPSEKVLSYISQVDQDVFLFNDTVKNNIQYARPTATDEEIISACCLANCHDFITAMSQGYDTLVGENGNRLSGGERRRLSIARAILKDSPIILLDEATASLDIENELAVKQAITNLLNAERTVIMIAHTLSVVKNADSIVVIDDGQIAEQGTHEGLIQKRGKYYSMWTAEQELVG